MDNNYDFYRIERLLENLIIAVQNTPVSVSSNVSSSGNTSLQNNDSSPKDKADKISKELKETQRQIDDHNNGVKKLKKSQIQELNDRKEYLEKSQAINDKYIQYLENNGKDISEHQEKLHALNLAIEKALAKLGETLLTNDKQLQEEAQKKVDELKKLKTDTEKNISQHNENIDNIKKEQVSVDTQYNNSHPSKQKDLNNKSFDTFSSIVNNKYTRAFTQTANGLQNIGNRLQKASASTSSFTSKIGSSIAKAAGPIALLSSAATMASDALKSMAMAAAGQSRFTELQNDAYVQRDIERKGIETQQKVQEINNSIASGLATFRAQSGKIIGNLQLDLRELGVKVKTGFDTVFEGYNAAAWNALNAMTDIKYEREKVGQKFKSEEKRAGIISATLETKLKTANAIRNVQHDFADFNLGKSLAEATEQSIQDRRDNAAGHMFNGTTRKVATASKDILKQAENGYGKGKNYQKIAGRSIKDDAIYNNLAGWMSDFGLLGVSLGDLGFNQYADSRTAKRQADMNRLMSYDKRGLDINMANAQYRQQIKDAIADGAQQIAEAEVDAAQQIAEAGIEAKKEIEKTYNEAAQKQEQWMLAMEKNALNAAASKGFINKSQNEQYMKFMLNSDIQAISMKWGVKNEDLHNLQSLYGQDTGRSLVANAHDMDTAMAIGKYSGDNNLPLEIANATEIFNMGMANTMQLVGEMSMKVDKMGLSGRKYMKDMVNNLKTAQKYNFNNGVKGMMEMAKWAQMVRFDMNKLPAILDGILGGGLEGIIEKASKLQVLGGNFAMGADPLAMMFEAMEDPDALAHRFVDMTKGMGSWDAKSGEVRFNGVEQQQLRLFAEYSGQSLEDVKAQAGFNIKKQQMGDKVNSKLNEEQQAAIINKAYYDQEKGWVVNDYKGNAIKVDEITADQMDTLAADTHEGRVEQMLQDIVGWQDKETGIMEATQTKFGDELLPDYFKNQKERYEKAMEQYIHTNEMVSTFKNRWEDATKNYRLIMEDIKNEKLGDIVTAVSKVEGYIKNALADLKKWLPGIVNSGDDIPQVETPTFDDSNIKAAVAKYVQEQRNDFGRNDYDKGDGVYDMAVSLKSLLAKGDYATIRQSDAWKEVMTLDWGKDLEHKLGITWGGATNEEINAILNAIYKTGKKTKDAVIPPDGTPMLTQSSNIIPVHDAALSDANDYKYHMKFGGPLDEFMKKMGTEMTHLRKNYGLLPKALEYLSPVNVSSSSGGGSSSNNSPVKLEPISININGRLELSGNNGNSIDILGNLKNNPSFMQSLVEIISEAIRNNTLFNREVAETIGNAMQYQRNGGRQRLLASKGFDDIFIA